MSIVAMREIKVIDKTITISLIPGIGIEAN